MSYTVSQEAGNTADTSLTGFNSHTWKNFQSRLNWDLLTWWYSLTMALYNLQILLNCFTFQWSLTVVSIWLCFFKENFAKIGKSAAKGRFEIDCCVMSKKYFQCGVHPHLEFSKFWILACWLLSDSDNSHMAVGSSPADLVLAGPIIFKVSNDHRINSFTSAVNSNTDSYKNHETHAFQRAHMLYMLCYIGAKYIVVTIKLNLFLRKSIKLLPLELLLWPIYAPNRLSAGALPQTPLGELTVLPQTP